MSVTALNMFVRVPQAPQIETFTAPWPIEMVSAIPAPNYDATHPRAFTRIGHQLVPDCRPGDVLAVLATFQVSNRMTDIAEVAAGLILTPDQSGVAGLVDPFTLSSTAEPPRGRFMKRSPGENVTPNQTAKFPYGGRHHAPAHLMCCYTIPPEISGDQYVAIVAYAAGVDFSSSRQVFVDAMCGDLSIIRIRT